MDITTAIITAGGQSNVARAIRGHGFPKATRFLVHGWKARNRLPKEHCHEYAAILAKLLHAYGHDDINAKDLLTASFNRAA